MTAVHAVSPEEVMAFVDGQLAAEEAAVVEAHVAECEECAGLVREFRLMSETMAEWSVPPVPAAVDKTVLAGCSMGNAGKRMSGGRSVSRAWVLAGSGVLAVLILFVGGVSMEHSRTAKMQAFLNPEVRQSEQAMGAPMPQPLDGRNMNSLMELAPGIVAGGGGGQRVAAWAPSAPMIARTVSLTVLVGDAGKARVALDALLARHHGYPAQLTVNTPEGAARSVQGSLRVPAPELEAALGELRAMGRVQSETQSGEEVTQQHADLQQRLVTARETEVRFQSILQQRTGKLADVLQVEEEIARVRGQIEGMEAEQQALEHRVTFATIDLLFSEEYKEPLGGNDGSFANKTRNAFVAGYHHAAGVVTGVFFFVLEFGPALLAWAVILGVPVFVVWRRYRKVRADI